MNNPPYASNDDLRIPRWARLPSAALALAPIVGIIRAVYEGRPAAWHPALALSVLTLFVAWVWLFGQIGLMGKYPRWFEVVYRWLDRTTSLNKPAKDK